MFNIPLALYPAKCNLDMTTWWFFYFVLILYFISGEWGLLVEASDMWHGQWVVWGYSGLTNEKPWNSSWSRLAISSWSGGVSSGRWRVKKRSKFSASRPHCHEEERERKRGMEGEMDAGWSEFDEFVKKKRTTTKRKKRNTTKTWHQPIKSHTAKTVVFHWFVCESAASQLHHWWLHSQIWIFYLSE